MQYEYKKKMFDFSTDNNRTGSWMWTNGGNIGHYQHWPGNHAATNTPNRQDCSYINTGQNHSTESTGIYSNHSFTLSSL